MTPYPFPTVTVACATPDCPEHALPKVVADNDAETVCAVCEGPCTRDAVDDAVTLGDEPDTAERTPDDG